MDYKYNYTGDFKQMYDSTTKDNIDRVFESESQQWFMKNNVTKVYYESVLHIVLKFVILCIN